jgi:tetratricopeptide (TPR) repeat protein
MRRSKGVPLLLLAVLLPAFGQTNEAKRIRGRDGTTSVTVSAGIPSEQLKIEDECKAKMEDAKRHLAAEPQKAIALLQQALAIAEKHAYLKSQQAEILDRLGSAYSAQGNSAEAIKSFHRYLQLYGGPCGENTRDLAACADEEMMEGFAKYDNDPAYALVLARAARTDLRRQQELDKSEVAIAVHKIQESEALAVEGVALESSGRSDLALASLRDEIILLEQVLAADLPPDLRQRAAFGVESKKKLLEKRSGPAIR